MVAPVTDAVAPVTDVVAPVTDVVAPVTDVVAPVTDVVAPVTDAVAPVTDVVAPVTDVVAPVTDVVAPVTNVLTPVSDVIAPGQYMPTSVAGAVVPLTQPPSDLSSFLLGIAGVAPVEDGSGGIHGPGLAAAAGGSGASPVPLVLPLAGVSGVPVAGNATRVATLDVIVARSSVSAVRDGTASAQWRLSDGCGVVFPACFRRTPANRFTVGAGRCRSARHRRACDPYRSRGAHPIRQANAGFASRTSGIAGIRPSRGPLSAGCLLDKVA